MGLERGRNASAGVAAACGRRPPARVTSPGPARGRRTGAALAAAVVSACLVPAAAAAAGGTSIARAPIVTPGTQETSNTQTDATVSGSRGSQQTGCWLDFEYWRLQLVAGDQVTLSATLGVPATNFEIGVFPPGTTDGTIANATAVATGLPNAERPLRFTAKATGSYVLVTGPNCYNGMDGPFTFLAAVTPPASGEAGAVKPVVVLPSLTRIPASGTLTVSVHTSAGAPITDAHLVLTLVASWKRGASGAASTEVLATAAPAQGAARFVYRLPTGLSGMTVQLHVAAAASPGYEATSSGTASVAVA